MAKTYEDQAFLVVNTPNGNWFVLMALGEFAQLELDTGAPMEAYLPGLMPGSVGFHVWDGRCEVVREIRCCEVERDGPLIHRIVWSGSWRPAVLGDFPRFGLPVPPPRLPLRPARTPAPVA